MVVNDNSAGNSIRELKMEIVTALSSTFWVKNLHAASCSIKKGKPWERQALGEVERLKHEGIKQRKTATLKCNLE